METQKLGIEETHKVIRYRAITESLSSNQRDILIDLGFNLKKHNGGGWYGMKDFSSKEKAKFFLRTILNTLHTESEENKNEKLEKIENLGFLSIKFLFVKIYETHSVN